MKCYVVQLDDSDTIIAVFDKSPSEKDLALALDCSVEEVKIMKDDGVFYVEEVDFYKIP